MELPAACCPDTNTGTGLRKLESEISSRLPEATPSAVPAGVVWKYLSQFQSHSFSLLFNAVVSQNFSSSCLFSGSLMLLTILGFYRINNSIQSIDLSIFVYCIFSIKLFSHISLLLFHSLIIFGPVFTMLMNSFYKNIYSKVKQQITVNRNNW